MKKIFGTNKLKVNKGDEVIVLCGKDKGKKGIVKIVFAKSSLIIVEGINKFKRAVKIGNGNNENFLIKERPMYSSKVKVIKKAQKSVSKKIKKEVKN